MKKNILLYLLAYLFYLPSVCMEAPIQEEESVPAVLQSEYTSEKNRLKKYHLENPEVFLKLLRTELEKEKNPAAYLEQLQILASTLLAQHLAMQTMDEIAFFKKKLDQIREQFYMLSRKLAKKRVSQYAETVELIPDNDNQLNEVLAHVDILKNKVDKFSDEDLKTIFSWILDTSKGEWINNLGKQLLQQHDGALVNELIDKKQDQLADIVGAGNKSPIMLSRAPLIAELRKYLYETLLNLKTYRDLLNNPHFQTPQKKEQATVDYLRNNQRIAHLYRIVQKSYAQMYKIVIKELYDSFAQLAKEGVKNITGYLAPIPEQARKEKIFPNTFPKELTLFQEPSKTVTVPSVEKQLEQARIEWEKSHIQESKIKKKYRRKKTTFPSLSATPEPEEIMPAKIRTDVDGSYILEGAENDVQLTIEDPAHDVTATIFKTKQTPANAAQVKQLPKIHYTPWVQMWFDNPENARVAQGFTDPKNPKYKAGEPVWRPIVLHAFPRLIDEYINVYGTVSKTPSYIQPGKDDILITIPGKMEFPDGKEETGVFTYIIDSATGNWYHRMFTPESGKKLIADLIEKGYFSPQMTGYYQVFFPALPSKKP